MAKKNICKDCNAICCRNLALSLKRPKTRYEIEHLRWQLHFDAVKVYIRHNRWHLLIISKCIYLSKDNMCTIYEKRPHVCREHEAGNCEMTGKWYDVMIDNPEQLDEYLSRPKSKKKKVRSSI